MFTRIVACVDPSANGRRALHTALELAARFKGNVAFVTVLPDGDPDVGSDLESLVPSHEGGVPLPQLLQDAVEEAKRRGAAGAEAAFLRGRPVEALLGYVRGHAADLVVVGTRGLSRGSRFLLGSVSSQLVAEAPCPVLVVRATARGARAAAESG